MPKIVLGCVRNSSSALGEMQIHQTSIEPYMCWRKLSVELNFDRCASWPLQATARLVR